MDHSSPREHSEMMTEEHREAAASACTPCRCTHHAVVPILAIIIGLEFFFAEIGVLTWGFVNVTWPLIVVIAGIAGLANRRCRCCTGK
jgi:hypothetical protein